MTASLEDVIANVESHAVACAFLGSRFYSDLLEHVAGDLRNGGPTAGVLLPWPGDPDDDALALRFLGTVHRLVLSGEAPAVAAHFPGFGAACDPATAWPAIRALCETHGDELRDGLTRPPQTNEVGRSAVLLGGLFAIHAAHGLPLRLHELGSSAGLNLRVDHFRIEVAPEVWWGPADSPVMLPGAWVGSPAPAPTALPIVERGGCDLTPLDPASDEGRLRLLSYVWPDDERRLDRLRGALDVASSVPATVVATPASTYLSALDPEAGSTLVIWHSVVRQYFSSDEEAAVVVQLDRLRDSATADAPVAHLQFEPNFPPGEKIPTFRITVDRWPGSATTILGHAAPHGIPARWAEAPPSTAG